MIRIVDDERFSFTMRRESDVERFTSHLQRFRESRRVAPDRRDVVRVRSRRGVDPRGPT